MIFIKLLLTNKTMKKLTKEEIKRVDVVLFDERFYQKGDVYAPSVTYILGCVYPVGYGLMNWIGDVGSRRAEEIRDEAGEDGSFVHEAIEKILNGGFVSSEDISSRFKPKRSLKVHRCLKAFLDWYEEYKPETIATEAAIWSDKPLYAGTLDYKCIIKGEEWIIDFKTSNSIFPSAKVQLSAYNQADNGGKSKAAILHLGNKTKKKYSFLEIEQDKYFKEFLAVHNMFDILYPNAAPNSEKFPEKFDLKNLKK